MNKNILNAAKTFFVMNILIFVNEGFAQVRSTNLSATFSGTINANLPTTKYANQPQKVYFPPAGVFMFSSTMYCGDGDVATFSRQYPNVKFYPTTAKDSALVIGYWAAPKGSSTLYPAPTMSNWFALGYASPIKMSGVSNTITLPIDGPKPITSLHQPNTGKETGAFRLVSDQLQVLTENATHGMKDVVQVPGFEPETYRLYVAAMACVGFTNVQGAYQKNSTTPNVESNGALATTISKQILLGEKLVDQGTNLDAYLDAMVEKTFGQPGANGPSSMIDTVSKFDVSAAQAAGALGVRVKFSPSGKSSLSSTLVPLTNLLKSHISNVSKGLVNNDKAIFGSLKASNEEMVNRATCNLGSKTSASAALAVKGERLNFEAFPTYGACQFGLDMATKSDLSNISLPADPSDQQWQKEYIRAIVKAFLAPAIMRSVQNEVQKKTTFNPADINSIPEIALNKVSCLPAAISPKPFDYITSIPNSLYLPIKSSSGQMVDMLDPGQSRHPEGGFAIYDYSSYTQTGGDSLAIFNNFYDLSKETDFQVTCGSGDPVTLTTRGANFKFKIRSIGCSQNVYCKNSEP